MARLRRNSEVELNFDGLTDCVTNLVGALVLLILLVVWITQEVIAQDTPPSRALMREAPTGHTLSAGELQTRLEQISADTRNASGDVTRLKEEILALEKRLQELLDKSKSVQPKPPEAEPAEPPADQPRKISFRPPFEHTVRKDAEFVIIANGGFIDLSQDKLQKLVSGGLNDSRIEHKSVKKEGSVSIEIRPNYSAKPRHISEIAQIMQDRQPANHLFKFVVFPDSFEAFREARGIVVKAGFDFAFLPLASDDALSLSLGPSSGTTAN